MWVFLWQKILPLKKCAVRRSLVLLFSPKYLSKTCLIVTVYSTGKALSSQTPRLLKKFGVRVGRGSWKGEPWDVSLSSQIFQNNPKVLPIYWKLVGPRLHLSPVLIREHREYTASYLGQQTLFSLHVFDGDLKQDLFKCNQHCGPFL